MNKLNLLLTLSSLNVILVTIERFSPTTKILLQPNNFLRLHELFQMLTLILFTAIIPFLTLKELSHNFDLIKTKGGFSFRMALVNSAFMSEAMLSLATLPDTRKYRMTCAVIGVLITRSFRRLLLRVPTKTERGGSGPCGIAAETSLSQS